ncbi:MAG: mannitol dehydrogenase family protein [Planctomycetota bacterium]
MSKNLIIGAGKISRGFIAHLLFVSGEPFKFVEIDNDLVEMINKKGQYAINVFGAPQKNVIIKPASAIPSQDIRAVTEAISDAEIVFISVGGKHLESLGEVFAAGVSKHLDKNDEQFKNIITCENWPYAADTLVNSILRNLDQKYRSAFDKQIGITESVIMRTAIEAEDELLKEDPLALNASDFWELPMDGGRVKGKLPNITGFHLITPFNHMLERKLYTYNAASATISYIGYKKGHITLAEGAHDKEIQKTLMGVYDETGQALCRKYNISIEDHKLVQDASFAKYKDERIVDFIERNARDPIRKLGPTDRLVGPASLALSYGIDTPNLATAIAAGFYYDHPADPIALKLRQKRKTEGVDKIITDVCGLRLDSRLAVLIKEKIEVLKTQGLIKDD